MEKLAKIELTKLQEIQNISIQPADNGGCVLNYSVYKPAAKHNESEWKNHVELFDEDEIDLALNRIKDLYRANLEAKKTGKAEVSPMAKGRMD